MKKYTEQELDAAYNDSNKDSSRLKTLRDWNSLNNVSDLIDEDENWDWLRKSNENRKN